MRKLPACLIRLKENFRCAVGSRDGTGSSKKGGKTQRQVQPLDRTAHLGRREGLEAEGICDDAAGRGTGRAWRRGGDLVMRGFRVIFMRF